MAVNTLAERLYEGWSMGWGWKLEKQGNTFIVFNSIGTSHRLETTAGGWGEFIRTTTSKSDMLWALSLNGLPDLCKLDSAYARACLEAFYESFRVSRHELSLFLGTSWDHCCAMRLNALSALCAESSPIRDLAREVLEYEINVEDYWSLIAPNNHGLMLLEALIASHLVTGRFSEEISHRATTEMIRILAGVFGNDGFCNENSPFYHHLYARILRDFLQKYRTELDDTLVYAEAKRYADLISESICMIAYQDGSLPPLGDSNPTSTNYPSVNGTFWSERTGFWLYKTEDTYFSFKCGYESEVHKHADDTSISLRFGGEDLILDSGTGNYDYSDSRIFALRTQAAHSGVFFHRFDAMHPSKLYGSAGSAVSRLVSPTAKSVRGGFLASGNFAVHRAVKVKSSIKFTVEDSWSSPNGETPVHRFIVPKAVRIEIAPSQVMLLGNRVSLKLKFNERVDASVFLAERSKPHRGWVSRTANEVEPAQCLELVVKKLRLRSLSFDLQLDYL